MQNIIKAAAAAFSLYTIESNTIGTRSCKALSNFLETRLPSLESFLEDFPILPRRILQLQIFQSSCLASFEKLILPTWWGSRIEWNRTTGCRKAPGSLHCLKGMATKAVDYKRYETNWFGHYPILFISLIWFLSRCRNTMYSYNNSTSTDWPTNK